MVKKYLTNMKEACENMPWCYQEYLALGKKICVDTSFKEYEHSFNIVKSSIEKPSCSNSVSKDKEIRANGEDSTKSSVGPSIMRLFGCSSNKYSKSGDMSTIPKSEYSSYFLENQDPLKNHPLKEKIIKFPEEEPSSASNESIDEEKEEGHACPNSMDVKDE